MLLGFEGMDLRGPLEVHFELFWALVARMALRGPLEAHFELFWALVARMAQNKPLGQK